jgi:hypothetical protein
VIGHPAAAERQQRHGVTRPTDKTTHSFWYLGSPLPAIDLRFVRKITPQTDGSQRKAEGFVRRIRFASKTAAPPVEARGNYHDCRARREKGRAERGTVFASQTFVAAACAVSDDILADIQKSGPKSCCGLDRQK